MGDYCQKRKNKNKIKIKIKKVNQINLGRRRDWSNSTQCQNMTGGSYLK
jgi:hypothetical protein